MRRTVSQIILDLFEKRLIEHRFKLFREGDPIIFPQSRLPALVVSEESTAWEADATGFDLVTHTMLIQVVLNKKDELGSTESLDKKLDAIIQGREEESGQLLPNTIMGVLRTDYTIENLSINNVGTVRKYLVARDEEQLTCEAHIDLTLTELVQITNRA